MFTGIKFFISLTLLLGLITSTTASPTPTLLTRRSPPQKCPTTLQPYPSENCPVLLQSANLFTYQADNSASNAGLLLTAMKEISIPGNDEMVDMGFIQSAIDGQGNEEGCFGVLQSAIASAQVLDPTCLCNQYVCYDAFLAAEQASDKGPSSQTTETCEKAKTACAAFYPGETINQVAVHCKA